MNLTAKSKVRGFVVDRTTGKPVSGQLVTLEARRDNQWFPTGVLKTDHAGFVSFSLRSLANSGTAAMAAIDEFRVSISNKYYALSVGLDLDVAVPQFVYVVDKATEVSSAAFPAIQDPDDSDREVSPWSFAKKEPTLLGQNGCEHVIPAGLAGFDYGLYRVYRITPKSSDITLTFRPTEATTPSRRALRASPAPSGPITAVVTMEPLGSLPMQARRVQMGVVLQFRQQWFPLGQSLGEIVYSLPLAPGEARDIAIIDWSRKDDYSRSDDVLATEYMLHQQSRDRNIEESINAALHEHQDGWSFLGGTSGAASAKIPIYGVEVSTAQDHALGVGIANSNGDRDLSGDSKQELSDAVGQATSLVRSIRSTVIVQAKQTETNYVQTRTVANYNRCHALTIQYYEVLRNYRVTTECTGIVPAILLPHDLISFTKTEVLHWRSALQRNLLDPGLWDCFDALQHYEFCKTTGYKKPDEEKKDSNTASTGGVSQQETESIQKTKQFSLKLTTGDRETWGEIWVKLELSDGTTVQLYHKDASQSPSFDKKKTFSTPVGTSSDIELALIRKVIVEWYEANDNDAWAFDGISIAAVLDSGDQVPILINGAEAYSVMGQNIQFFDNNFGKTQSWSGFARVKAKVKTVKDPLPSPNGKGTPKTGEEPKKKEPRSLEQDECCSNVLVGHIQANKEYYSKVVWVGMDSTERRLRLIAAYGNELVDQVDDTPLAVSGNQVAFRYRASDTLTKDQIETLWAESAPTTQFASIPARGVFAEAELGHCDACEMRNVNYADPFMPARPPEISGITPGPKGQLPNVTAGELPAAVVQVNQPLPAPDPTGLAAAFTLLGQPNIFRDMSGMKELNDLLKGLVSGSIKLTEAQILAKKVQGNAATSTNVGGMGAGGGGGAAPGTRTQASESDAGRQKDRLDILKGAIDSKLIDKDDARGSAMGILGGEVVQTSGGTAPAHKTGVGAAVPSPSASAKSSLSGMISIASDLALKTIGSDTEKLGYDLAEAMVEIAKHELHGVANATSFGKTIEYAVDYSRAFAEGVGAVIDEKGADLQRLVDEAVNFPQTDEISPEGVARIQRVRQAQAIAIPHVAEACKQGFANVFNRILGQATGAFASAIGSIPPTLIGKIIQRFHSVSLIDRLLFAAAEEFKKGIPDARVAVYGLVAQNLARLMIATYATSQAQRAKLNQVLAATGSANPAAAVLRSFAQMGVDCEMRSLGMFTGAPTDKPLADAISYECKRVTKKIVDELTAAGGWNITKHNSPTVDVNEIAQTIDLPNEYIDGPSTTMGPLTMLEQDLATDELAFVAMTDGLDAGVIFRGFGYQADIDNAPVGMMPIRFQNGMSNTVADAAEARQALGNLSTAFKAIYAGTPLESYANTAFSAFQLIEYLELQRGTQDTPVTGGVA